MRNLSIILFFVFGFISLQDIKAQDSSKTLQAAHFHQAIKIDGKPNEKCWKKAPVADGFHQYNPNHGEEVSYSTEVMIGYDREHLYIAARMHDPSPDSILRELGTRDTWVNADRFTIQFDTYHNRQNSYNFHVTASGVQIDNMRKDWTYDAVWKSEARIHEKGWTVEIAIPFTELRFPDTKKQNWGLQIKRLIRRYREDAHWSLEPKGSNNTLDNWGTLKGLKNISHTRHIAFRPYLSLGSEHFPEENSGKLSYSYSGGLDLNVGFNGSYSLDMTLLPDFSQVKSDNKVKNLSAFEQTYSERRPFFIKNMDLFRQGGLIYTRRIGETPDEFYNVEDTLRSGEKIINNPSRAQLLNAFKVSGRSSSGLALGVFNAITGNTHAKIETPGGDERKVLTEPATNYNIVVADQALKNNSSVYVINTNVARNNGYSGANVTGSGITVHDPSTTYKVHASAVVTEDYKSREDFTPHKDPGSKYYLSASKVKGNVHFQAYTEYKNSSYDINDMGVNHRNNQRKYGGNISYRIYEPFWIFRKLTNKIVYWNNRRAETGKNENTALRYRFSGTFKNYLSIWGRYDHAFGKRFDYYEPREEGRYYLRPEYESLALNTSSDYRKDIALNTSIRYSIDDYSFEEWFVKVNPRLRLSNRWFVNSRMKVRNKKNDKGYVTHSDSTSSIIFGNRDITTIENSISSRFMFSNKLSLKVWARHYWSVGKYDMFYNLLENGSLQPNADFDNNSDFNYNSVNIDVNFDWELAPGSKLSLIWKNQIISETDNTNSNLMESLDRTFEDSQRNTLSVKLLYYIDYEDIKTLRKKSS